MPYPTLAWTNNLSHIITSIYNNLHMIMPVKHNVSLVGVNMHPQVSMTGIWFVHSWAIIISDSCTYTILLDNSLYYHFCWSIDPIPYQKAKVFQHSAFCILLVVCFQLVLQLVGLPQSWVNVFYFSSLSKMSQYCVSEHIAQQSIQTTYLKEETSLT